MNTQTLLDSALISLVGKLGMAMLCGVLLGTERIIAHKTAGMRTYALACMGAAFFIIIGQLALASLSNGPELGIFYIASAIITGIGFMGAGVIILRGTNVTGVTTASGLWVSAGIGMACGFGFLLPAAVATILTLFIFIVLWQIEERIRKIAPEDHSDVQ